MEIKKLTPNPLPNLIKLNDQVEEYQVKIQNRILALTDENLDVNGLNVQVLSVVEVAGKKLMETRRNMKTMTVRDKIELDELTKSTKKKKKDVRKFNMNKVNEVVNQRTSSKTTKRTLGISKGQIFALRKTDEQITHGRKELVKAVEDFCKYCIVETTYCILK